MKRQVDGILLISTDSDFHITYRQLFQKFPIVSLNEVFVNEYSVLSNNAQGIRKAMEYLIRLGHKKIAMITGELNQKPGIERFKEYRECLSENGIRFSKKYVKNCTYYSYEEGYEIMKKLLEQLFKMEKAGISGMYFRKEEGKVFEGHSGEVACDHYHRFREDVALMKKMGVQGYRFSINWSRVFPNGTGTVNEKGLKFYHELVDELCAANIEPYITLYHWELPYELYKKGGSR